MGFAGMTAKDLGRVADALGATARLAAFYVVCIRHIASTKACGDRVDTPIGAGAHRGIVIDHQLAPTLLFNGISIVGWNLAAAQYKPGNEHYENYCKPLHKSPISHVG